MRRVLLILAAAVIALVGTACDAITPYAAKVNDSAIAQRALESELRAILDNRAYLESLQQNQVKVQGNATNAFDSAFVARILTRQIFLELVHQEVEKREIVLTPAQVQAAEKEFAATFEDREVLDGFPKSYRDLLARRTAEVTALQAELAEVDLSDDAIRKYYQDHQAEFRETCVAHILYETKPAADAARAKLVAGADFATTARAESKDPGSGLEGGSLGCVGPASFVPEFERAMDALPPGEISQPVQSQFGFHLIRVDSRKSKSFEDASDEIRQRLLGGAQGDFNEFLQQSLESARIEVNPRYGRFVKDGQQPGVVPPDAPEPAPRSVQTVPAPPDRGDEGDGGAPPGGTGG